MTIEFSASVFVACLRVKCYNNHRLYVCPSLTAHYCDKALRRLNKL